MDKELTDGAIRAVFANAGDFVAREMLCGSQQVYVYMIDGLIAGVTASDLVFKPLSRMPELPAEALYRRALTGSVYNNVAADCQDLADAVNKLVNGFCVVLFPGVGAVAFETKTPEKRSIAPPEVESTVKGPKDAFTETMRTNTSLLRRHLRTEKLCLYQTTVGSATRTNVTVAWIDGITDPVLVQRMKARLSELETESFLSPAEVEELVTGNRKTPFPLLQYTERTDKFARGLLSGRVGLLVDGLPLGYLLPVDLGYLMTSPEDLGMDYVSASFIRVLRWGAMLLSLLLPAVYVALAMFHQQMIPLPLLRAIIDSKANVPFSAVGEVLGLLLAFELLQEAGLHLPRSVGQSVSIIGGIVVGTAAVEASLISPAALIVVSLAGISGFAMPNRDLAEALRLFRFVFALLGAYAGLFGVTVGVIGLVIHLSALESLGEGYLNPFSRGGKLGLLRKRSGKEKGC
ncbi:MAG: spore germination protein [Oscillospiraceae bacterium]|nr:spore germination protein [Oscillospiraceae bacterium]